jgi:hypothetical protein
MRSNISDAAVVDAMDYGSGGGGSAQLRPNRCDGGVIGAAGGSGSDRIGRRAHRAVGGSTAAVEAARRRHGSGVGAVGRCGRGILARCVDDGGVGNGGSGAVWEASAGGDQTESFDLLTA